MNAPVGRFFHDGFDGLPWIDGPCGVAGGIEYHGKGIWPHGINHFLGVQLVIVLCAGGNALYSAAIHADQGAVKHERRVGDDKLPSGCGSGRERQIDCLGGASGDHQVFRHQRTLVSVAVIFGQGFEQFREARVHGVAGLPCVQCVHGGLDDMVRWLEVRLANGKVNHVIQVRRQIHHAANARHRNGEQRRIPDRVFAFVEIRIQIDIAHHVLLLFDSLLCRGVDYAPRKDLF